MLYNTTMSVSVGTSISTPRLYLVVSNSAYTHIHNIYAKVKLYLGTSYELRVEAGEASMEILQGSIFGNMETPSDARISVSAFSCLFPEKQQLLLCFLVSSLNLNSSAVVTSCQNIPWNKVYV